MTRVQHVFLPPYHLDKPGDRPKCKGFALIVLSHLDDVEMLLTDWPWDTKSPRDRQGTNTTRMQEAAKFGFKTLSKHRWDELQEEYRAYRQKLLAEMVDSEEVVFNNSSTQTRARERQADPPNSNNDPLVEHSSPYPMGCLVFTRNVHPETNKTTLRALFSAAFSAISGGNQLPNDGLDYVDFNKGSESVRPPFVFHVCVCERERERVVHHQPFFLFFSQCHLRLRSPRHTQVLVDHFSSYPKVQSRGLDGVGTTPDNIDQAIKMEIVHGKREEVYWEKVPEGVRQQAVRRALTQTMDDVPEPESVASRKGARQRRKRET